MALRKQHAIGDTVYKICCSELRSGKIVAECRKQLCLQHGDGEYATFETVDRENAFDDEVSATHALVQKLGHERSGAEQKISNALKRLAELAGSMQEDDA